MFVIFANQLHGMSRTKKDRLIQRAPHFSGFKPQGVQGKMGEDVTLHFEEYEAVKLCDYELLNQAEAAMLMKISRPTLTRIYESARRKIAKALVESCNIHFEGGKVTIATWYKCTICNITFTLNENSNKVCPLCKSDVITLNS